MMACSPRFCIWESPWLLRPKGGKSAAQFATERAAKDYIGTKYLPAQQSRFHIEKRLIKADNDALRMTFQCCGRKILANLGSIALQRKYGRLLQRRSSDWRTKLAIACGAVTAVPGKIANADDMQVFRLITSSRRFALGMRLGKSSRASKIYQATISTLPSRSR
jgi:hypothetical protein